MLRRFRQLALTALALTALAAPALAVDSTFALTPTSGYGSLQVAWTDTVTLSSSSSTWTKGMLNGHNFTTPGNPIEIVIDIEPSGPYAHGGSFTIGFTVQQAGTWNFGQKNEGLDPNSNPWYTGSQDIYVTITGYPGPGR